MILETGFFALLHSYSGAIEVILLSVALVYTHFQLRRARQDRLHANVAAINERVFTHNALVLADQERCAVVAAMQELQIPEGQEKLYWAARAVHLGHVHILAQVWELSGRPMPGKPLLKELAGWESFARDVVAKSLSNASTRVTADATSITPADFAGSDVWRALSTFDATGKDFNAWLTRLTCACSHELQLRGIAALLRT